MKKRIILIVLQFSILLFPAYYLYAKSSGIAVPQDSLEIVKGEDAVLLKYHIVCDLNQNTPKIHYEMSFLALTDKANKAISPYLLIHYNQIDSKVENIKGESKNKVGHPEKIRAGVDVSADDAITDERMVAVGVEGLFAGGTVNLSYDILYKNPFFVLPIYLNNTTLPIIDFSISIVNDGSFFTKFRNVHSGDENNTHLTIHNQKRVKIPPNISIDEIVPHLLMTPKQMAVNGKKFDLSNWVGYGEYIIEIQKNKDTESTEIKNLSDEITKGITNQLDKAKAIFRYVRDRIRYVSIDMDKSGYVPHSSSYINDKKFGDCKDFTNLFCSLMSAQNLKSYPIIGIGRFNRTIDESFVANYFDHEFVLFEYDGKTYYVDPTDKFSAFGLLRWDYQGTKALLLKEGKSSIIELTTTQSSENIQSEKIESVLNNNGTFLINDKVNVKGVMGMNLSNLFNDIPEKDRIDYLKREISREIKGVTDISVNIDTIEPEKPFAFQYLCKKEGAARRIENKIYFIPFLTDYFYVENLPDEEEEPRDTQLYMKYSRFIDMEIKLPTNSTIESLPKFQEISSPFGSFSYVCRKEGNSIHCTATFSLDTIRVSKDEIAKMKDFLKKIKQSLQQGAVISFAGGA